MQCVLPIMSARRAFSLFLSLALSPFIKMQHNINKIKLERKVLEDDEAEGERKWREEKKW